MEMRICRVPARAKHPTVPLCSANCQRFACPRGPPVHRSIPPATCHCCTTQHPLSVPLRPSSPPSQRPPFPCDTSARVSCQACPGCTAALQRLPPPGSCLQAPAVSMALPTPRSLVPRRPASPDPHLTPPQLKSNKAGNAASVQSLLYHPGFQVSFLFW